MVSVTVFDICLPDIISSLFLGNLNMRKQCVCGRYCGHIICLSTSTCTYVLQSWSDIVIRLWESRWTLTRSWSSLMSWVVALTLIQSSGMQRLCAYVLVRMVLLASLLEPHLHCLLMVYYCTLNKMMSCKCGPDSGHDVFVLKSIGRYLQLLCFVIAGFSKPSYWINQISLPYLAIKCNQSLLGGGNYFLLQYRSPLCYFIFFIIILVWERERELFVWLGRNCLSLRVSCSFSQKTEQLLTFFF